MADSLPATSDGGAARRSLTIPQASFWRKLFTFSGPGYLVAVGYMDPGNWATGLAAGTDYGYRLLFVILMANLIAMFLQGLAAKLGIVTELDLAQACRRAYGRKIALLLWLLCELAIVACDFAELIGAAIALKLLFGLPLFWGVATTGAAVLLLLGLQHRRLRPLEVLIVALILVIATCFAIELALAQPQPLDILRGMVPDADVLRDPRMLYVAIGILGATVMPHNLYLHSAMVKSRGFSRDEASAREALRFAKIDVVAALSFAIFVNAAILVLAAASFHRQGLTDVGIEDAYRLLGPTLGAGTASVLFAIALLAAGQNSSITGTLAGQIVMEGFTDLRLAPWLRRLVSRLAAMVPAMAAVAVYGDAAATSLLILSQVVLSLQLPFAVYPLVRFTGNAAWMGRLANRPITAAIAWTITIALIGFNGTLLMMML